MGECKPNKDCWKSPPCLDGNTEEKPKYIMDENHCDAICPEGFFCTRVDKHEGEHEARTEDGIAVARWK